MVLTRSKSRAVLPQQGEKVKQIDSGANTASKQRQSKGAGKGKRKSPDTTHNDTDTDTPPQTPVKKQKTSSSKKASSKKASSKKASKKTDSSTKQTKAKTTKQQTKKGGKGGSSLAAKLRPLLDAIAIPDLKARLRANDQIVAGNKGELIKRIIACITNGCLPRCPQCSGGRLKHVGSIYRCPGYHDDEDFVRCDYATRTINFIAWKPEKGGDLIWLVSAGQPSYITIAILLQFLTISTIWPNDHILTIILLTLSVLAALWIVDIRLFRYQQKKASTKGLIAHFLFFKSNCISFLMHNIFFWYI